MTQISPPEHRPQDALLAWAYWLNVGLVVLAVPLALLYLLIMSQATNPPLNAAFPLLFAAVAIAHLPCLTREKSGQPPFAIIPHALIAITGAVCVTGLFWALLRDPQGGAFLPFSLAGAVISFAVWRTLWRQCRALSIRSRSV